jgi:hypothetical protein
MLGVSRRRLLRFASPKPTLARAVNATPCVHSHPFHPFVSTRVPSATARSARPQRAVIIHSRGSRNCPVSSTMLTSPSVIRLINSSAVSCVSCCAMMCIAVMQIYPVPAEGVSSCSDLETDYNIMA